MKKTLAYRYSKAYCMATEAVFGNTLYRLGGTKAVTFSKRIRYSDDKKLYLITCEPKKREEKPLLKNGKLPVFFYIHGGGFVSGAPVYRRAVLSNIADRGDFAVGVFYGLAPQYTFPSPVVNLYRALAFVLKNAELYGIDTDRIYIGGESAGGTLTLTMGAISVNEEYKNFFDLPKESKDTKFCGVVPICGIYDIEAAFVSGFSFIKEYLSAHAGRDIMEFRNEEEAKYLSPSRFLTNDFPPTFVITGERCAFYPDGVNLINTLNELGIKNGSFHGTGKTSIHAFPVGQVLPLSKKAFNEMFEFLGNAECRIADIK
jgi:acetyl esterase/lipase